MGDVETNWIDFLISLSPVVRTGIWAGVAVWAAWMLKDPISKLAGNIVKRVEDGDSFSTPWLSFEKQQALDKLENAPMVEVSPETAAREVTALPNGLPSTPDEWFAYRGQQYEVSRDLFLVHVLSPSREKGQKYDIYIYLKAHKDRGLRDVLSAEFFLGHYWGNKVFTETPKDGLVGLKTAAYGPFLCLCKVHLKDGTDVMLSRYVDFEMGP